jgi:starvation-inducible DNA-binding protein
MPDSSVMRSDETHAIEALVGEIQAFNVIRRNSLALHPSTAAAGVMSLNQLLADTLMMRDLYKKCHWQVSGPHFYTLHLLFDKHFKTQSKLVDLLAERIQTLGGVSIAMAPDVAEITRIPRVPKGREDSTTQIGRLLQAHEIILLEARAMARAAATRGDVGTDDLIVSDVIRTNELQVWFLDEHVR